MSIIATAIRPQSQSSIHSFSSQSNLLQKRETMKRPPPPRDRPPETFFLICLLQILVFFNNFHLSLQFCPPACDCNDAKLLVDCHKASMRHIPIFLNPKIEFLSLKQNLIKEISMSFQFYKELHFLDISSNLIDSIGEKNFENLEHLKLLNVSYNSIKRIETGAFIGLGNLEVLDFTGTEVEQIGNAFSPLILVKEIILDKNRLNALDWASFRGLNNLVKLSIKYNFIQVLEPSSIWSRSNSDQWSLRSITFLDMSHCQLTRLTNDSIAILSGLQELILGNNYIHTIEKDAFLPLPSFTTTLEKVSLNHNRFTSIPTDSLEKLGPSLKKLDLSSNNLKDIGENSFRDLFNVEELSISDNPSIVSIHPNALSDNINLVLFEADHLSNLTSISALLFKNKTKLEKFSLKFAQIETLIGSSEAFSESNEKSQENLLPVLLSLDVTGNPIECNCSSYPIFKFVKSSPPELNNSNYALYTQNVNAMERYGDLICHKPSNLKGLLIKDLKIQDFEHCFLTEPLMDSFQMLVICIAVAILLTVILVLGIKLCCFCGSENRSESESDGSSLSCCFLCPERCCHCSRRKKSPQHIVEKEKPQNHEKILRRDFPLPPTPPTIGRQPHHNPFQNTFIGNEKSMPPPHLFYANGNGSPLIFQQHNNTSPPSSLHHGNCNSNGVGVGTVGRQPQPPTMTMIPPEANSHHYHYLTQHKPKLRGAARNNFEDFGFPHTQPITQPPPSLVLQYEYPYTHFTNNTLHRMKQVPSVLV